MNIKTINTNEITARIGNIAEKYNIILIYIFGSQKDNFINYINNKGSDISIDRFSDLDVGVVVDNPSNINSLDLYGRLFREFSELFEPFDVDIVFFHEVDAIFQYEIIKGFKVYEKYENRTDFIEEIVIKKASDIMFKKKEFDKEVLEAAINGYFELKYNPDY
ncbi:MAG: nucleotidyltransferase family protein [bacterium]